MKIVNMQRYIIGFLISFVCFIPISAQEIDSTSVNTTHLDLYRHSNLWLRSMNAAGLNDLETLVYTDVSGSYSYTKGQFTRVQEGKKNNGFIFDAEGAVRLKGAYMWGKFSLETEKRRDSQFNASIIDPFRGMPFIVADENISDWRIQYYNLETKISMPKFFDKLYAGIGVNYNVATGAKQLNPRPENRYYKLELTPSLVWTIDDKNRLGGTFYYSNMHEISNINIKYTDDVYFYELEGLGVFKQSLNTAGKNRDYRGNAYGAELNYAIKGNVFNLLMSARYIYDYEDVIDGSSQLINISKAIRDNYYGNIVATINNGKHMHELSLEASYRDINGIFYDNDKDPDDTVNQITLNKKTRSKFKTTYLAFGYNFFKLKDSEYSWTAGTNIQYQSQKDKYLLPSTGVESSYENTERYNFEVHGKYNIDKNLPFKGRLLIDASAMYSLAGDNELFYGGTRNDHIVITDLLYKDFLFLSKNYWKFSGGLQYSVPLTISSRNVNVYGKVNASLIPKTNLGQRANLIASLGFIL